MKCNFSIAIFGAFSSNKKSKTTRHCIVINQNLFSSVEILNFCKFQNSKNFSTKCKKKFFWNFQKQTKSEATLGQLCFIKFWGFDFLVHIWRSFIVLEIFFQKKENKILLNIYINVWRWKPAQKIRKKKLKKVMCTQICDWTLSLRGKCRFSIFVGHTVVVGARREVCYS